jgi:H+-translocating NAD(P) transhydrogenase subunit beta
MINKIHRDEVVRTCSRSSEQHREEGQVNELQAGVEPSLAILP